MKKIDYISQVIERYPILKTNELELKTSLELLVNTVNQGGTIYACGNGGAFSDAQHLSGELLKSFVKKRRVSIEQREKLVNMFGEKGTYLADKLECGIPTTCLGAHDAFLSAFANDVDADLIFGQELFVRGNEKDILICISTSGNSKNVKYAAMVAKLKGIKVILLTGKNKGTISEYADVSININETETYKIQELNLPIYHAFCLALEEEFY